MPHSFHQLDTGKTRPPVLHLNQGEKEVLSVTSPSRTTLWLKIKRDRLPKSVVISAGHVGWRESAFETWQTTTEAA